MGSRSLLGVASHYRHKLSRSVRPLPLALNVHIYDSFVFNLFLRRIFRVRLKLISDFPLVCVERARCVNAEQASFCDGRAQPPTKQMADKVWFGGRRGKEVAKKVTKRVTTKANEKKKRLVFDQQSSLRENWFCVTERKIN